MSGGDTSVDTGDDLLGDRYGIDVVHVKTIAESGDSGCDLVELDTLLAAIFYELSARLWLFTTSRQVHGDNIPRFLTYIMCDICLPKRRDGGGKDGGVVSGGTKIYFTSYRGERVLEGIKMVLLMATAAGMQVNACGINYK